MSQVDGPMTMSIQYPAAIDFGDNPFWQGTDEEHVLEFRFRATEMGSFEVVGEACNLAIDFCAQSVAQLDVRSAP
jgi:hypothetical protein